MAKFKSSRQQVYRCDQFDRDSFDCRTLGDVVKLFQTMIKKHGEDGKFEVEYEDCFVAFRISSFQEETDQEYEQRKALHTAIEKHKREEAKERKRAREEHDLKEYDRLKKKFEK